MKKAAIRLVTIMLAFMMVFGNSGVTANAAKSDAKVKSFCKTLSRGSNKFAKTVGSYKVRYKKKGGKYIFNVTLNSNVSIGMYQISKAMAPSEYYEARDSVVKTTIKLKKKAKKAGIKKSSFTYTVMAKGVKLWVIKDGVLIYDKLSPVK
ncbi:hypothetical protein [Butyrivibrio sp. JL13D10]|uniref:hypothetical protein n=1 Tax=Butyrivibrio sp. JL13D10 TaxID=3236815 RepID=UPI0038B57DE3